MDIDIVIIGLNAGNTLDSCLSSINDSSYTRGKTRVTYVDSGSTDKSTSIAEAFGDVNVIKLNSTYPSPGAGRNAGWKSGNAKVVQFLDSDTILAPDWLDHAVDALESDVAAVRGLRREIAPEASTFNWIADQEWNASEGDCSDFGGDVLVRRSALEATGGYDEEMVGGEDPELSQRIRNTGGRIVQLPKLMTLHDLAMRSSKQYFKRAFRTGYGFAAVVDRHPDSDDGFWKTEFRRILVRGGVGMLTLITALVSGFFSSALLFLGTLLALVLILFPRLFRVSYFAADKKLTINNAKRYAWHCSVVVIPEFFGIARYWFGRILGKPLRNRRIRNSATVILICLASSIMTGCMMPRFDTGVHDFTKPDRRSRNKNFNVNQEFEAETEKEAQTFATEEALKKFSQAVPENYHIGGGDVIAVIVRERPDVSVKETTVSPDGKISVPRLGILNVKGKTLNELSDTISQGLSRFYDQPDVTVHVHKYSNNKVYVLGRVANPGLVSFGGDGTLIEALALAGGLPTVAQDAFLSRAVIFRGKEEVLWVDLREVLENGNVAMNPRLQNNDLVFIPESDDELVYVMGEVDSPGAVKLKTELSVLDAVMASGGPTKGARISKTYLIRFEKGKGHVQQIAMTDFLNKGDLRQDYLLKDGDIIYISSKPLDHIASLINKMSPSLSYLNFAAVAASTL